MNRYYLFIISDIRTYKFENNLRNINHNLYNTQ